MVVLAGKMYGSGSSRDWAAKAPLLLGVRAVIAESFERIHRSNLVGMGILPLQFHEGENAETLGLDGTETFVIEPVDFGTGEPSMPNPREDDVSASKQDGETVKFHAIVRGGHTYRRRIHGSWRNSAIRASPACVELDVGLRA